MIITFAKSLLRHRGFYIATIVMSWQENDENCKKIETDIKALASEFKDILSLRIDWKDLFSCYIIPPSIKLHTVFYMTSFPQTGVINIGKIYNPNYPQLKNFYLKCKNVVERLNFESISQITINPAIYKYRGGILHYISSFLSEDTSKENYISDDDIATNKYLELEIFSKDCSVFQFIRLKDPSILL